MASIKTAEQYFFGSNREPTLLRLERNKTGDSRESIRALRRLVREGTQLPVAEKVNSKEKDEGRKKQWHTKSKSDLTGSKNERNFLEARVKENKFSWLYRSQQLAVGESPMRKASSSFYASLPSSIHMIGSDRTESKPEKTYTASREPLRLPLVGLQVSNAKVESLEAPSEYGALPEINIIKYNTDGMMESDQELPNVDGQTASESKRVPADPGAKSPPVKDTTGTEANDTGESDHSDSHIDNEEFIKDNWVLKEEIRESNKKFENRKRKLLINIAEDDPLRAITSRLDEIRDMTKPRRQPGHVLDRMEPEARDRIMKIHVIPMPTFKKNRRKGWKLLNKFRQAAQTVRLLIKCFTLRKKYHVEQNQISRLRKGMNPSNQGAANLRSSLGLEFQSCLTTHPRYRDPKQIRKIIWLLRATKAMKHLFPAEMEKEVARYIAYEKYEDGRVLAHQARTPDRFYYIITGRVNLLRQYKLSSGKVTKSMGFLTKGKTTDPEEMEKQWNRETSLVAKGQVEVLLLEKEAFRFLQHTTQGPPVDFLRSLDLFEEFPVEKFLQSLEAIEYKYFGQNKVIVKDANRTPWLHVIKSGNVKVVRKQPIIDVTSTNESKFKRASADELGCGKSFSHAEAMLGVQAKQRKTKAILKQIQNGKLPMVYHSVINETRALITTPKKCDHIEEEDDEEEFSQDREKETDADIASKQEKKRKVETGLPPILNIPVREDTDEDFRSHSLWLTRERTDFEPLFTKKKKQVKEVQHRRAYLQLDLLKPGDVFGLDHMHPALASEAHGVSLLSDGAEVIKISKRFFLHHAQNNTMLKVETMYREYMSEEDAQDVLYRQETWEQYKSAILRRTFTSLQLTHASPR